MKYLAILAAGFLITPTIGTITEFRNHSSSAQTMTASHRGQWRKAPENSLEAVRAAYRDGAEIAEIDVRLTKDRVPVLMHDSTVDRTTNGKGLVSSLTLTQIKALNLRQGLGGANAALTTQRVPTLKEIMTDSKGKGLINLDKSWTIREDVFKVLSSTGTVNMAIFKSTTSTPVSEVNAFRNAHPSALYMHPLSDRNLTSVQEFGTKQPLAYEVIFSQTTDKSVQPAFIANLKSKARIWVNTMTPDLAGGNVDNATGWNNVISKYGTTVIQTDNTVALETYLRSR